MTHRITPFLSAVFVCLAGTLIACGSDDPSDPNPQPQFGTVQGTVTEQGGPGIAGAQVSLARTGAQTRTTTTSGSGEFAFQQVETGTWTLTVAAPAGFTGSGTSNVTVTANQTTTVPAVVLEREQVSETVQVAMTNTAFSPQEARVAVGGTVRWVNQDPFPHNSTGANNAWSSGNMNQNDTFERTFPTAGTFNYTCTLHAGMDGTIIVE